MHIYIYIYIYIYILYIYIHSFKKIKEKKTFAYNKPGPSLVIDTFS